MIKSFVVKTHVVSVLSQRRDHAGAKTIATIQFLCTPSLLTPPDQCVDILQIKVHLCTAGGTR